MALNAVHAGRVIPILYEDETAVVFNKPPGLLVIPNDKKDTYTLTNIVNQQYQVPRSLKDSLSESPESFRLHPCHRLDKDTSGAILFAKGKRNQQLLMGQFKSNQVQKKYIAYVHGRLKKKQGEINSPIKDLYQSKFQKNVLPKPALTRFKVIEERAAFSVVEVVPVTGRTNQIRIHFTKIGHPLVGEDRYIFRRDYALRFKRAALHALEIGWQNSQAKKQILVRAPLASDMEKFLSQNN